MLIEICNLIYPTRAAAQGRFGGGLRLLHLRPLVPGEPDIDPTMALAN